MTDKHTFEQFIIQCCKAKEGDLRKFLKRTLTHAGFEIKEDDYRSGRGEKYSNVHNMLAIRGEPRVCLVAHTDVCRDHIDDLTPVEPVIKTQVKDGEECKIIQSKYSNVQVGGDDRLGVAINTYIALNSGYDMGLLFTTDEEIGVVSASHCSFPELLDFDILLQVDRGNHSDQLVDSIGGCKLCSDQTTQRLLKISDDIGLSRYRVNGMLTDVYALKTNHMCKDAVNMTCGYHNSYGAQEDEFIDIQEAKDTVKYVASIIKYYDLGEDKNEEPIKEEVEEETEISYSMDRKDERQGRSNRHNRRRRVYEGLWDEETYDRDKQESSYFEEESGYRNRWDSF
jgi:hypothetical protein